MSIPEAIRGALARIHDPHTSHAAADSITEETIADSRDEVLYLLASYGPLADHELVAKHEHEVRLFGVRPWSPSRLRTARNELVVQGKVRDIGGTKTPSGRHAILWALEDEETK